LRPFFVDLIIQYASSRTIRHVSSGTIQHVSSGTIQEYLHSSPNSLVRHLSSRRLLSESSLRQEKLSTTCPHIVHYLSTSRPRPPEVERRREGKGVPYPILCPLPCCYYACHILLVASRPRPPLLGEGGGERKTERARARVETGEGGTESFPQLLI